MASPTSSRSRLAATVPLVGTRRTWRSRSNPTSSTHTGGPSPPAWAQAAGGPAGRGPCARHPRAQTVEGQRRPLGPALEDEHLDGVAGDLAVLELEDLRVFACEAFDRAHRPAINTRGATAAEHLAPLLLTPEEAAAIDAARTHGRRRARAAVRDATATCTPSSPSAAPTCAATPGEISFPGGRQDPDEDLRRPRCARPTRRSGCRPTPSSWSGALPPIGTFVTGYGIHPFVGVIEPGPPAPPARPRSRRSSSSRSRCCAATR